MSESIHGHEVMQMMLEHDGLFTRESLIDAICERFGEDSRFHSCQKNDMNIEQLIEFLEDKGKFIVQEQGFQTSEDKICHASDS
ncbi:YecH family metal-binding protein [Celerinatantimonas sp. YJH-8]|uniref:YecH family metal-binding protein n=1 Tax=Celerinatantimonas sp. YJH-8 TaxID=3228714 RepID=UPI0038C3CEDF